jgi:probable rRNA maturation factor
MKLDLDVQYASRLASIPEAAKFKRWIKAALEHPAEITLRVVNEAEGRNLNSAFRGKDYATNVLTFVYHEPGSPFLQGDVILCAPVVSREAREQGKPVEQHYAHLTVHGVLHLAGMDHVRPREAEKMESREIAILERLKVPNPYEL